MNHQRGGVVLDLILAVAIFTTVGSIFYMASSYVKNKVNAWGDETYAAPVREKLEADLKTSRAETAEALAQKQTVVMANEQCRKDVEDTRQDIEITNGIVDELRTAVARARAARVPLDAEIKSRNADLAQQNFDLLAALSAPDPGGKCEDRMSRIDAHLRKLGTDSIKFNPPTGGKTQPDEVLIRQPK